jgi:hypothetical protein
LAEFYRNKSKKDGYCDECKPCNRANHRQYYLNNKDKYHADTERRRKKKLYGLEDGDYERMLAEQNHSCGICGTDAPGGKGRFHIDHCHKANKVRALLCHNCNRGIGLLKDSPEILTKAAEYIRLHNEAQSWEEAGH